MTNELATSGELIDYIEVNQCYPPPKVQDGKYYIVVTVDEEENQQGIVEKQLIMKQVPPDAVEYVKKMVIKGTLKRG